MLEQSLLGQWSHLFLFSIKQTLTHFRWNSCLGWKISGAKIPVNIIVIIISRGFSRQIKGGKGFEVDEYFHVVEYFCFSLEKCLEEN